MAYEKLDQALRQLKRDRERAEEIETAQRRLAEKARTRFPQINSQWRGLPSMRLQRASWPKVSGGKRSLIETTPLVESPSI